MKKGSRTCGERERDRERSTGSKSRNECRCPFAFQTGAACVCLLVLLQFGLRSVAEAAHWMEMPSAWRRAALSTPLIKTHFGCTKITFDKPFLRRMTASAPLDAGGGEGRVEVPAKGSWFPTIWEIPHVL